MEMHQNLRKIRAWMIHFYTSLGLICGLMAIISIWRDDPQAVFAYLGIALFIDATDGTLARAYKVKTWAPQLDGRKLDDITDYINYAFIPAFFAYRFGLVSGLGGLVVLAVMVLCAVYGFCQQEAKTGDGFFTGFPNFWNLVIFYLYFLELGPVVNGIILAVLSGLIFVPVKYVSYSTRPFRKLTATISLAYGIMLAAVVATMQRPDVHLVLVSLVFPVYYVVLSLYLSFKSGWQTENATDIAETKPHQG